LKNQLPFDPDYGAQFNYSSWLSRRYLPEYTKLL